MIHDGDNMMYARTIIRVLEANGWNKYLLAQILATPWSLHVPRDTELVFKDNRDVKQQDLKGNITFV